MNVLAIYVPIAWRALRHRTLAHADDLADALAVLNETQMKILRLKSPHKIPISPSANDALHAVAGLGGHLKRNGPPGWITIARGCQDLLMLEQGVKLAQQMC
jgi:hypothetical protein